jgi:hypothetical protein
LAPKAHAAAIDPILIEECLSPRLVGVAKRRGHDSFHVVRINREGYPDRDLAALIAERNYVFVTNNRRDFLRLYASMEIHNGLIVIVPNAGRAEQIRLFELALDAAERQESLVNLLIEVHADRTVEVRNWAMDDLVGKD